MDLKLRRSQLSDMKMMCEKDLGSTLTLNLTLNSFTNILMPTPN